MYWIVWISRISDNSELEFSTRSINVILSNCFKSIRNSINIYWSLEFTVAQSDWQICLSGIFSHLYPNDQHKCSHPAHTHRLDRKHQTVPFRWIWWLNHLLWREGVTWMIEAIQPHRLSCCRMYRCSMANNPLPSLPFHSPIWFFHTAQIHLSIQQQ